MTQYEIDLLHKIMKAIDNLEKKIDNIEKEIKQNNKKDSEQR
jgi:tetrahydromethanopterin S-methyltransferase subunit G